MKLVFSWVSLTPFLVGAAVSFYTRNARTASQRLTGGNRCAVKW